MKVKNYLILLLAKNRPILILAKNRPILIMAKNHPILLLDHYCFATPTPTPHNIHALFLS